MPSRKLVSAIQAMRLRECVFFLNRSCLLLLISDACISTLEILYLVVQTPTPTPARAGPRFPQELEDAHLGTPGPRHGALWGPGSPSPSHAKQSKAGERCWGSTWCLHLPLLSGPGGYLCWSGKQSLSPVAPGRPTEVYSQCTLFMCRHTSSATLKQDSSILQSFKSPENTGVLCCTTRI